MNLVVILDSSAGPGDFGYCPGKRYRISVGGREVKRCTYVFAVLGFGFAFFHIEKAQRLHVVNGFPVEGITFGRVMVEQL